MLGARKRCTGLANARIEVRFAKLFDVDAVDGSRSREPFRSNLAFDTHYKAGAGEGMAHKQIFGHTDVASDAACGIFYFRCKRRELRHSKGDTRIVMHFYFCDASAGLVALSAFSEVGVERALCDEVCLKFSYFFFEYLRVDTAHCDAFVAHVHSAFQCDEESLRRVDNLHIYPST